MNAAFSSRKLALAAGIAAIAIGGQATASLIIGGDAVDFASAQSIVDIVFVIDTSASMSDDITAIGNAATLVVQNLNCPDIDCFVRARFMGITANSGAVFNENVAAYVNAVPPNPGGPTPLSNSSEDNGPAVIDLVNYYEWGTDAGPGQKNYNAIVTIGDEGTENGAPVNQADWDLAYAANQAAIAANILVFSWVTDDPSPGVTDLFTKMAIGGTGGISTIYTFGNTNGGYLQGLTGVDVEQRLEDIICAAAGGGGEIPEPAPLALLAGGLGLLALHRRRAR